MKIMIYDCDNVTGLHEERIVTNITRNITYNGYSLTFGEYELIIVPAKKIDIENLKYRFSKKESVISPDSINIKILLKKNNILFRSGEYLYDEINNSPEKNTQSDSLSFWIKYSNGEEGQIVFSLEHEHSLLAIYNKIFLK